MVPDPSGPFPDAAVAELDAAVAGPDVAVAAPDTISGVAPTAVSRVRRRTELSFMSFIELLRMLRRRIRFFIRPRNIPSSPMT
ncbi:hypothetical protein GCM10009828_018320 [Actinoplanes couchii]|uniref:Uncharacterized protein n=1 Tax=Actinoplanes couchii TaxID=403638 RepID=A0ABQ3XE00_9ACTN|nr:hypothetical protein Aco03nite_051360 [Actinoplanes couchii]